MIADLSCWFQAAEDESTTIAEATFFLSIIAGQDNTFLVCSLFCGSTILLHCCHAALPCCCFVPAAAAVLLRRCAAALPNCDVLLPAVLCCRMMFLTWRSGDVFSALPVFECAVLMCCFATVLRWCLVLSVMLRRCPAVVQVALWSVMTCRDLYGRDPCAAIQVPWSASRILSCDP
jgi:hypothetical protein